MERIKIDLLPSGVMSNAYASQYDVGRTMRFVLTYNGEPYELTGAEDISLILRKPDKTEQTISLPNTSSDYVDWITDTDEIDLAGIYLAEIRIEEGSVVLGSANFILKAEEDPLGGQITTLTATGNPCTFETNIADELQSLKCEINASGGGGTPSNPIPIVGHSELNLTRFSVNLWDEQTETGYYDSVTGEKKPLASEIRSTNLISVKPNTTYAKVGLMAGYSFIFFDSAKNFISRYVSGGSTFTTPANCYYIGINFGGNYGNTYNNDVSINYPSTDTDYHAYNGQTYTVNFGQTVYGGVYDKSGRLTITHGIVDLGTLDYTYSSATQMFVNSSLVYNPPANTYAVPNAKCSQYKAVSWADGTSGSYDNVFCFLTSPLQFRVRDTRFSDPDVFKTAMSGVMLAYELATPIVIDVPSISVFAENGVNNIISDCIGDVNVTYIKKV